MFHKWYSFVKKYVKELETIDFSKHLVSSVFFTNRPMTRTIYGVFTLADTDTDTDKKWVQL